MLSKSTVPPLSGIETVNTVTNINGNQQKVDWERLLHSQPVVTEPDPHIYACVLKTLQNPSHGIIQCYPCMIPRPFGFAQISRFRQWLRTWNRRHNTEVQLPRRLSQWI